TPPRALLTPGYHEVCGGGVAPAARRHPPIFGAAVDARPDPKPGGLEIDPAAVAAARPSGRREGDRAGRVGPAAADFAWNSMHAAAGAMLSGGLGRVYIVFLMLTSIPLMIAQEVLVRLRVPLIPEPPGGALASPLMAVLGPPLYASLLGVIAGLLTWPMAFRRGVGFRRWLLRSAAAWVVGLIPMFGIFVVSRGLDMVMPEWAVGAFDFGLVLAGLGLILTWPLAASRARTFRGRVRWAVVAMALG